MIRYYLIILLISFALASCNTKKKETIQQSASLSDVPSWAQDAIWYQIFVERFRSGSDTNNPTRESLQGAWPDRVPESWTVTPWTQEWYKADPWFKDCDDPDNFYHGIQARRYGGDLLGVLEKLDYLESLGINAIYFNPINDAPSLHKYDPAHYRHVDRFFGPDPEKDRKIMSAENPADPDTWQWTTADQAFLKIINECHRRGIRVVLDYSWNHTGRNFWAFKDIQEKGEQSDFKDWYYINSFDNPETDSSEFNYTAWFGAMTLPELKEDLKTPHAADGSVHLIEGNFHSQSLKDHIFAVTQRWMDPDGDGDPVDGIDGYRLDVAAEIPMGFWREYREHVKSINPEAILIGEIWWELWPDKLLDPEPFLGDAFDAVMNYRWYREARRLIAQAGEPINVNTFKNRINSINQNIDSQYQYAMMNLLASHDSPRVLSSIHNIHSKYKQAKPHEDAKYNVQKPDRSIVTTLEQLLVHQYTMVGTPHIWNGDEMGMWGADDPDCRKPLIWPDMEFEDETQHPLDGEYYTSEVKFDSTIYHLYRSAIKMRNDHKVLRQGSIEFIDTQNDQVLAYKRVFKQTIAFVFINLSNEISNVDVDIPGTYRNIWDGSEIINVKDSLEVVLAAGQSQVWIKQ